MAIIYPNLYTDYKCTNPAIALTIGVAAATGWAADPENWNSVVPSEFSEAKILWTNAKTIYNNEGSITLSGGSALYNNAVSQTIPWYNEVETDKELNGSSNVVYNPMFCSYDAENHLSYYIALAAFNPTNGKPQQYSMHFGYYTQEPEDASGNNRTSWRYWKYNTVVWPELFYPGGVPSYFPSEFSMVKVYKLALGDILYYLFAFGVSADNRYNVQQSISNGTDFVAIPVEFFQDKEARPWVGDESESDEETGFSPTTEIHDVITSRELSDEQRNPFGINAGTGCGLKVVFPNKQRPGGVLTSDNYLNYILGCIYRGRAAGLFNKLEQRFSGSFNGNTNRPAEEVSAMISAIVCCHTVPYFTVYESSYTKITSLGGYSLNIADFGLRYWNDNTAEYADYLNKANSLLAPSKTIFDSAHTSSVIAPRLNCFLDYEPYTKMTLQLPFFKPISLSPSMVYDHTITANYRIDILTGFLYVDVFAGNVLVTSMSTNVKTDIPIIGQGANGGGLSKIMSSISSLATSSNESQLVSNGITSAFNIADAISTSKFGTVVGKEGNPALAPYCTPRTAYLMITHPRAAIPVARDGEFNDTVFLNQLGMRANLGYKIKELAGGWNKFSAVNLSQVNAPQYIKDDILSKLREGVYIE